MKKPKYYPSKYFFLIIIIISLSFIIVNFWQLSKIDDSHKPILTLKHRPRGRILGEENDLKIDSDYLLIIKKLRIKAPIILDVSGDNETKYFKALEKGIAHFKGTSKPDENGNIVLFGHSSVDIGATGKYSEIFSKLGNLEKGDEIKIFNTKNRSESVYTIYGREVIKETDLSILEPTDKSRLTIFTCWPIGSDEKRLVVYAKPE